jgi:putative DNA primase/helicase
MATLDARAVTLLLDKGRWHGSYGTACCPSHGDRRPSLSIRDGERTVIYRCHSGCSSDDVARAVQGLLGGVEVGTHVPDPEAERRAAEQAERRRAAAWSIWQASGPDHDGLVRRYLNDRAIRLPLPPTLRFHPSLSHPESDRRWPAMVAVVQDVTGRFLGIHRSYLDPAGGKAPVGPAKLTLGAIRGGAVRLGTAGESVAVGEGIESTLSAGEGTGLPGWAALNRSCMGALVLPEHIADVAIFVDGDAPGRLAGRILADRLVAEGRRVRIADPGDGLDFNDLARDADTTRRAA